MANNPPDWQYPPQPPAYNSSPLGPVTPPPLPATMQRAVNLMRVGVLAGFINGIVVGLTVDNATFYTYSTTSPDGVTGQAGGGYVGEGVIAGIVAGCLWLWMVRKTEAGRNWARVLSTVFFGFMCLQLIPWLIPADHSFVGPDHPVFALLTTLLEWGIGLAAVILLWQRESSLFFQLAKQARRARKHYGY
jgi:hypothetical protein